MRENGFTLAELLIALAILGVIATFTIPKVLNSQQDGQKSAVFRETIAALESITISGVQQGELNNSNNGSYILSKLNAVKICDTDSSAQGCWNQGIQGNPNLTVTQPGLIMHNGAFVVGLDDDNSPPVNNIYIDYNGLEEPNIVGQDQIYLAICYGAGGCAANIAGSGPKVQGKIGPINAADVTLYEEIFSN